MPRAWRRFAGSGGLDEVDDTKRTFKSKSVPKVFGTKWISSMLKRCQEHGYVGRQFRPCGPRKFAIALAGGAAMDQLADKASAASPTQTAAAPGRRARRILIIHRFCSCSSAFFRDRVVGMVRGAHENLGHSATSAADDLPRPARIHRMTKLRLSLHP
jgi:hypothetical protein